MKFLSIVSLSLVALVVADFPAPIFDVDLDAPAISRYADVVNKLIELHGWEYGYGKLVDHLNDILPASLWEELNPDLILLIDQFPGEYPAEVKGLYATMKSLGFGSNITLGQLGFMQLFYELNNVCTSIVAQAPNGTIFHGRNLDYGLPGLPNITATINFIKDGKTLYQGTQYVGYMGILTGMRPGGWAISVNQRFAVEIPLLPTIEAMANGAQSVGFALRDALSTIATYKEAMPYLSNTLDKNSSVYLNSPVYLIMSGVNHAEGTVLSRKRNGTDESGGRGNWKINPDNGTWFRLETNDDNWKIPMDDRRNAANKAMEAVGVSHVDLNRINTVLDTPPVLASHTTYTTLMSAALGKYSTTVRTHEHALPKLSPREIQLWRTAIDWWLRVNGFRSLDARSSWSL